MKTSKSGILNVVVEQYRTCWRLLIAGKLVLDDPRRRRKGSILVIYLILSFEALSLVSTVQVLLINPDLVVLLTAVHILLVLASILHVCYAPWPLAMQI